MTGSVCFISVAPWLLNPKLNPIRFDADDLKTEYAMNGRRAADELERRIRLHLLPYFGGRRLSSITTGDVNAFILKRQKDVMVVGEDDRREERRYSNGEINRELTTLKRILNLARQNGLERLLETQETEHERLKAEGVICPWVFNRSNRKVKGKRITTFQAFRAACTKAGCPGRIPHDLRRTAVRNLVRAGIPERVAMQMTGHKDALGVRALLDRERVRPRRGREEAQCPATCRSSA